MSNMRKHAKVIGIDYVPIVSAQGNFTTLAFADCLSSLLVARKKRKETLYLSILRDL